jgi:hypothetical protein
MVDTAGTLCEAAKVLKKAGCTVRGRIAKQNIKYYYSIELNSF